MTKWGDGLNRSRQFQLLGLVVLVVVVCGLGVAVARSMKEDPSTATDARQPSAAETTAACAAPERVVLLGDSTRDPSGPGKPLVDSLIASLPDTEVLALGKNGARLFVSHSVPKKAVEFDPDIVEVSIGINDLRTDQRPERAAEFTEDLTAYVEALHQAMPEAKVQITVPAALSALDVDGSGYVAARDLTVNPPGAADQVTKSLRKAYLDVAGALDYVTLVDVQEEITGTDADESDPPKFLSDQIHPNPATASQIAGLLAASFTAC